MKKIMKKGARIGKKYACAFAAIALISMMSGCQSMDTTKTGSIGTKPVVHSLGKKVHQKRLHLVNRKPLTRMSSVMRTREVAYAAFVRTQRVGRPAPVKVSYSLGKSGPLLGHSPWICGPSGFGQRASCRSRY
ncbi:hypothetical protein [Mesorhizobium sp. LjRoot246]|uniref:hypothetical protein n=1 Tax=Mesorhizobium sp. LjRoot246 TaxID=3342294 RepID=UPI003ECF71CD